MDKPNHLTTAKILAIPTAFLLSGYGTGFSQNSVPLLYAHPAATSARILDGIYHQGAKLMGPGVALSTSAFAYLAYHARPGRERSLYAAAGALVLSTQPWTFLVMLGGIRRLGEIAESADVEQKRADESGEVVRLLKGWALQNWFRAAVTFAGGMVGVYAQLYA